MRIHPTHEKRLELLNVAQPDRPWRSCGEKRQCVACENVFRGEDVVVHWSRNRIHRLTCPMCDSGPALWVRLGNPLIDEQIWADWESAMELVVEDPDNDLAAAS